MLRVLVVPFFRAVTVFVCSNKFTEYWLLHLQNWKIFYDPKSVDPSIQFFCFLTIATASAFNVVLFLKLAAKQRFPMCHYECHVKREVY